MSKPHNNNGLSCQTLEFSFTENQVFSRELSNLLGEWEYPSDESRSPETENAVPAGPRNGVETSAALENRHAKHNPELADLLGLSPLDQPIHVSHFEDVKAQQVRAETISLRQIADLVKGTAAPAKSGLPLLKLATFGDQRRDSGSLRHDGNLLSVSGIEGDYDAGQVPPEDAADRLRKAGVAALIYTTPSHTADAPRWRVLCPLAGPVLPAERDNLCARVNGALGGILAGESFTRSQSYYFGAILGAAPPSVYLIDGRAIDMATDLPSIGKGGAPKLDMPEVQAEDEDDWYQPEPDWEKIKAALRSIKDASDRQTWLEIGASLHHETRGDAEGLRLWSVWSKRCPGKFNEKDQRRTWASFGNRKGDVIGIGTLYHHAKAAGWNGQGMAPTQTSRLNFLSPSECEAAPSRGYLIKGLFAPGDVGCIFGAPGAGKSLLAPFLGYMVAQGAEAFGMRSKAGGVFYVAAEDAHGMRGRVKALKAAHGDAPTFHLVEGVSDLLVPDSPDLHALEAAVKERRPALIFIDTLAMAFPGLEENSAEAMGRVVAAARRLAEGGAAVMLIHHDTKAEGATPRGHSLLNGALDVALHVKRDESGVIRGKLTKNRNGTCERDIAFIIATEDGGTDDDGDEIRLPRCDAMTGSDDGMTPRLSSKEAAALEALQSELRTQHVFADGAEMGLTASSWDLDLWRETCRGDKRVCSTESRNSQNVAFNRALEGLIRKAIVTVVIDPVTGKRSAKLNSFSGIEV